ncbi:MAG: hypothetical protein ACI3YT_11105 [Prevotella sp.]
MTQKEFEIRTGLTVSADEYAGIEAVYMAAGEMDKDVFCAEWKKIGGSRLVMELFGEVMRQRSEIERLKGDEQESRKLLGEAAEYLIEKSSERDDNGMRRQACRLIGEREVVMYKLNYDQMLCDEDIVWIREQLS